MSFFLSHISCQTLDGLLRAIKVMLGELTDKSNQGVAFSGMMVYIPPKLGRTSLIDFPILDCV